MINKKYSFRDFSTAFKVRVGSIAKNNVLLSRDEFIPNELENAFIEVLPNPVYDNLLPEIKAKLSAEQIVMLSDTSNDGVVRKIVSNTETQLVLESDLQVNLRAGIIVGYFVNSKGKEKPFQIMYNDKIKIYWDVSKFPVSELNNSTIKASNFYQEWKEGDTKIAKDIFPKGMIGVTFQRCNLNNVVVPAGNVIDGEVDGILNTNKKIKVHNDLEDWVLDSNDAPVEPISKKLFLKLGLSVNPADIPSVKLTGDSVIQKKTKEIAIQREITEKQAELNKSQIGEI